MLCLGAHPMHPLDFIHAWIAGHSISFALILAFGIGAPSSIYASEIKQFLRLPPQRLNVWILRARLSATELKIVRIKRAQKDLRYFIFSALEAGVFFASWLFLPLFLGAIVVVTMQYRPEHYYSLWMWKGALFLCFVCAYIGIGRTITKMLFLNCVIRGEAITKKLEHKVALLEFKLRDHNTDT